MHHDDYNVHVHTPFKFPAEEKVVPMKKESIDNWYIILIGIIIASAVYIARSFGLI